MANCEYCGKKLKTHWKLKDAVILNPMSHCDMYCKLNHKHDEALRRLLSNMWRMVDYTDDEKRLLRLTKHFNRALRQIEMKQHEQ